MEDRSAGGDVSVTAPEDSPAGDSSSSASAGDASTQDQEDASASTTTQTQQSSGQPAVTQPSVQQPQTPTVTAPESEPEPDPEPASEPAADPEPEPVAATADAARAYIGQSASSLIAAIGSPISSSYAPSCLGPGRTGNWSMTASPCTPTGRTAWRRWRTCCKRKPLGGSSVRSG